MLICGGNCTISKYTSKELIVTLVRFFIPRFAMSQKRVIKQALLIRNILVDDVLYVRDFVRFNSHGTIVLAEVRSWQ